MQIINDLDDLLRHSVDGERFLSSSGPCVAYSVAGFLGDRPQNDRLELLVATDDSTFVAIYI